ncbi:hypothetical protein [Knoellia subterranea]|uniref:Cation-transporting ATPase n=1 Tax=Knoellia subterranea KCTC 19937 TaxID=1385521 RepID=A0A0A0JNU3_9MICO|nr:hypothetical protein [Knoellia subterranea]KGN38424.1 hypothetical protein N803_06685 [Knoellia subterranea KCTC 19937]
MGFLDKLLGREPRQQAPAPGAGGGSWTAPSQGSQFRAGGPTSGVASGSSAAATAEDDRAVARYRYLLRTAPPDSLEQVHAEAFARLTPEQRQQVLTELSANAPAGEVPASASAQDLARAATRAEMRQPGTLERAFGRTGFGGVGMGGTMMGSMMGTIAGVVVGSAIANALFDGYDSSPEAAEAGDSGADVGADAGGDVSGDAGAGSDAGGEDFGGEVGGSDFGGSDVGGSDFGGDFGGGDFGGGDFGGS